MVDYDEAVCHGLALYLTAACIRVTTYTRTDAFLRDFAPHPGAVLLLDAMLPRLGSVRLLEEIVRRGYELTVVLMAAEGVLTASGSHPDAEPVLLKPVTEAALRACLRACAPKSLPDAALPVSAAGKENRPPSRNDGR